MIGVPLHRLESLIFLGTQPLNLLHLFIFLHSVGISLPDELFLTHIPVGVLLIQCNALFYDLCLFCTQLFFLPFQCGKANQRFAFPFVHKMLVLFNLTNLKLLIGTTVVTFAIYAVFYTLVYRITSNSYYSIVAGAKEEAA